MITETRNCLLNNRCSLDILKTVIFQLMRPKLTLQNQNQRKLNSVPGIFVTAHYINYQGLMIVVIVPNSLIPFCRASATPSQSYVAAHSRKNSVFTCRTQPRCTSSVHGPWVEKFEHSQYTIIDGPKSSMHVLKINAINYDVSSNA